MKKKLFLSAFFAFFSAQAHADQILTVPPQIDSSNVLKYPVGSGYVQLGVVGNGVVNIQSTQMPAFAGGDISCPVASTVCIIQSGAVTASKMASGAALANGALSPTGSGLQLTGMNPIELSGAKAGGSFDNSSVFAALTPGYHVLTSGTYRISVNVTIPAGVVLDFRSSSLSVDSGVTVTMHGWVPPTIHTRVFTGLGSVVGLAFNRPEWWNSCSATYSDTCDSAPAINAAIASMEASFNAADPTHPSDSNERRSVSLGCGRFYTINGPINLHPGVTMPESFLACGNLNGGSEIITGASFSGAGAILIHGVTATNANQLDFHISDFLLQEGANSAAPVGIYFDPEGAGYQVSSVYTKSLVENVGVFNFPIDWNLVNTLGMEIRRPVAAGWTNTGSTTIGVNITTIGTGPTASTGEIYIDDLLTNVCSGHVGSSCQGMAISTASGRSNSPGLAAIQVRGGIFEQSGATISVSNGGLLADVWFNKTQFDGYGCNWITAHAYNSTDAVSRATYSLISDLHMSHLYHTGTNPGCISHSYVADIPGVISAVVDDDGYYNGQLGEVALFFGTSASSFRGNSILSSGGACTGSGCTPASIPAIEVGGGATSVAIEGNTCAGLPTTSNYAQYNTLVQLDSSSDYISDGGNIGFQCGPNLVNNSSGTHNLIGTK